MVNFDQYFFLISASQHIVVLYHSFYDTSIVKILEDSFFVLY